MPRFTAIGLGEILWDVLPQKRTLGGAPANFAYHVNQLGGVGIPISRVGDDELGRQALETLQSNGIVTDHISIDLIHPTGTVNVVVGSEGGATYTFPDDVAWDHLSFAPETLALASTADAICFGTLAQRGIVSREAIGACLLAAPHALKVYDINLRQEFFTSDRIRASLDMADILKINDEELTLVIGLLRLPGGERDALGELIRRHGLKLAVLTRGSRGSLILSPSDFSDMPGVVVSVADTIGAGDSFTAAMVLAYLQGWPLEDINRYATRVAAYVCSRDGAMPRMPEEMKIK